ncbi:MAG TPA: hypothetical protein VEH52_00960 [Gaiellaceae bacterium]|nr:hypothetical protein [Gaiellaceae bacterium]
MRGPATTVDGGGEGVVVGGGVGVVVGGGGVEVGGGGVGVFGGFGDFGEPDVDDPPPRGVLPATGTTAGPVVTAEARTAAIPGAAVLRAFRPWARALSSPETEGLIAIRTCPPAGGAKRWITCVLGDSNAARQR